MTQPREPTRWADPTSDSDPVLRRLLQNARAETGDAGLAVRIEQALQARTAADSGSAASAVATKPTAVAWRPWIGVATLLLGVAGAIIASRSRPVAMVSRANKETAAASVKPSSTDTTVAAKHGAIAMAPSRDAHSNSIATTAATRSSNTDASRAARSSAASTTSALRSRTAKAGAERANASDRAEPAPHSGAIGVNASSVAHARTSTSEPPTDNSNTQTRAHNRSAPTAANAAAVTAASDNAPRGPAPTKQAVAPELSLISAAQRALRTSPSEALALADRHKSAYPNGRFSEEREEIAISALWALGDRSAARARAHSFLVDHPRALSAPRITRLLGAAR